MDLKSLSHCVRIGGLVVACLIFGFGSATGPALAQSDESLLDGAQKDADAAWEATKETSSDVWDATKDGASDAWEATKETSTDAWEATQEGAEDAYEGAKEAVEGVGD